MQQFPSTQAPSPAPLGASGYKVDVSGGERIGRVSSEWFARPADERYLSLADLHGAVKARADRSTARTLPPAEREDGRAPERP